MAYVEESSRLRDLIKEQASSLESALLALTSVPPQ
jgi:hypothetical protein